MPPYINVETSAWQLAHDMRTYGTLQPHAFLHPPPAAALGDAPYYIDRGHTAWCMHAQTRAFAAKLTHDPAPGVQDARTQKVQACVQNSIEIMNAAAGADWGGLFVLRLRDADTPDAERIEYTLEFCSRVDEDSDYESVSGLNTAATVASRLKVTIEASDQHAFLVFMDAGNTIMCLRCMHLATLLRACALLIAQQLACLCGSNETVGLGGIPQAPETKRIYNRIFNDFKTNDFFVNGDIQIGTLRNGSATDVPQSLVNVAEMLWRWHDKSAFMCHEALPAQIRRYKADVCECGTSRKLPHGVTAHGEVPGHAADAQACINACNGSAQPAHLFPAAALAHEPYSSATETAGTISGLLWEFADNCKKLAPGGSAWSWRNIDACVRNAVHVFNDAAGAHWSVMFKLSANFVQVINPDTLVYYLQFEANAVLPSDMYQPSSPIPSNQCVVSRLELSIKETHPSCFNDSEYTEPFPKYLVSMDEGNTVFCMRQMHLAMLLRACALLVAQQIACLGTGLENVGFKGIPVTEATHRMYAVLFRHLRGPTLRPLPGRDLVQNPRRQIWHAQLDNMPGDLPAKSIENVVDILWKWYQTKAPMYNHGPLPAQIQHSSASAAPASVGPAPPACHRRLAQIRHSSASAAPASVGPAPPACHRRLAQIRHSSASAAPASVGPAPASVGPAPPACHRRLAQIRHAPAAVEAVPPVCHQVPAQMPVNMHEMFQYRHFQSFIGYRDWNIYHTNLKVVLAYLQDASLNYETVKTWPFGRSMCFYIQWTYTWNTLENSRNESDKESIDRKLGHALSCAQIPGASLEDFFKIEPEQIITSNATPKNNIDIGPCIHYGVTCCEIAERAKQENTKVQNNDIFMTLVLVFVLQSNSCLNLADDFFSILTVLDAFQQLADMWDEYRNTFAGEFAQLKAIYNKQKNISKKQLWTLILCPAPAQANANDNARAAYP